MSHQTLSSLAPRRLYSQASNIEALDRWIASKKQLVLSDTIRAEHLSDLYITLPTRDGMRYPYAPPKEGAPLGYGHHLAFFHARNPEGVLRGDGTDADFCPPEPFTRRMWAGGKMIWKRPLLIGAKANAAATIESVAKKGFEKGSPMVFVKQRLSYTEMGSKEAAIEEERSHVYLAAPGNRRRPREVESLPAPDFSFTYRPTPTTLFRFSALTFNGHHIHLDKDYAQKSEGYSERLVHGPLTALMLLETVVVNKPHVALTSFEYRAVNPLVVNQTITVSGAWVDEKTAYVWAIGEHGVVGMTGTVYLQ